MSIANDLDALADRLEREARDLRERAQRLRDPVVPAQSARRFLHARDLAELLAVNERTIRRWRSEGRLPEPIAVAGIVRWRREDVDVWLAQRGGSFDQPSPRCERAG